MEDIFCNSKGSTKSQSPRGNMPPKVTISNEDKNDYNLSSSIETHFIESMEEYKSELGVKGDNPVND